MATTPNQCYYL